MKRLFRSVTLPIVLLTMMLMIVGCGEKEDVFSIFIMDKQGDSSVLTEKLAQKIQEKLGEGGPKVEIATSALYNQQKLIVEYAAGDHDLFILPEEDMKNYGQNGANLPLDDDFDSAKYPRGVFEGGLFHDKPDEKQDKNPDQKEEGTGMVKETHLYGIPVEQLKMFQEIQYTSKDLFVTIPPRTHSKEEAIKVLKALTE